VKLSFIGKSKQEIFPVMINIPAVMYKNKVQSNVIIIFINIFSRQQFVSSLLTPLAFPRNGRSQKCFEQGWEEYYMMQ